MTDKKTYPQEKFNKPPENYNQAFARIYDDLMAAVPYNFWFKFMQLLLMYHGQTKPEQVLELACGTGSMMKHFLDWSCKVTGIDRSQAMLTVAERKLAAYREKVSLKKADIRNFTLPVKFSLIYAIFDSLNYLLTEEDLYQTFCQAKSNLSAEGLLLFDYNTCSRLESIKKGYLTFTGQDYHCIWEDLASSEDCSWQVRLSINLKDRERVFQELHQEKAFALKRVKSLLYRAGFSQVYCYGPSSLLPGREEHNRVYFLAGPQNLQPVALPRKIKYFFYWAFQRFKYNYF